MHRRTLVLATLLAAACVGAKPAKCPPQCVSSTGWRRNVAPDGRVTFTLYRVTCVMRQAMSDSSSTDTTAILGDSSSVDPTSRRWHVDSVVVFAH
jgi:hypothetical protein